MLYKLAANCLKAIRNHRKLSTYPLTYTKTGETNTNIVKDVILYKYENPRFFKYLNLCGVVQFGFWTYLSSFAYTQLRDAPVVATEDAKWYEKINLGDNKYRNTFAAVSFLIGYGLLTSSWFYTLRSVRYLILRKGGNELSFVTYTPLGQNRIMTVNLKNVSAQDARNTTSSTLLLKVKNRIFAYVLDMKGEFKNPTLFDVTAGLKRNL